MKKSDYDKLKTSIKQAGKIRRAEARPSRVTKYSPLDVKVIRQKLGKSGRKMR